MFQTVPLPVPYAGGVSIVVPVRDEVDNVEPLIDEIHRALTGCADFEVVFVDDGSRDGTAEKLDALRSRFERLRVLRHAGSCGQSTALRSGVRAARHSWIGTLDGDGQNDPADMPGLLAMLDERVTAQHLGLVAGWRVKRHDTALRRLSSRVANGVRGSLLKDATPDTGCGLKVFSREVFLAIPFFDHFHRFLPALFMREGCTVISVPVSHRERRSGRSKYGLFDRLWVGIVDMLGVAWLQRRMKRPQLDASQS